MALSLASCLLGQPPAVNQESVINEASHIGPSLPGGALAPGSRVIIRGIRFGSSPHVRLRSGGADTELRLLTANPREIRVLLPDSFAVGSAELTVSNDDGPSRPFPVRIAAGSLGIYTENGSGWGPAKIAASNGRRIAFLGTGCGTEGCTPARAVKVSVGGKRGRLLGVTPDKETGISRIEVEIPPDAPSGCNVPLLIRLPDGLVSNAVTIRNGTCDAAKQDPFTGAVASQNSALVLLARLHVQSAASIAADLIEDFGAGVFASVETVEKVLGPYRLMPPEGTCSTYTGLYSGDIASTLLPPLSGPFVQDGLDAGNELEVSGPNGTRKVEGHKRPGIYGRIIGFSRFMTTTSRPAFLSPGDYSVAWRGGPEVPPFRVPLTIPPSFTWTNAAKFAVIDRNTDLTLKWKQGRTPQRLAIVAVNVDPNSTALATCFCLAPRKATDFTIPAMMLANLPRTSEHDRPAIPISLLALVPLDELQRFRAQGLEIRTLVTSAQARVVIYH